jgi:hypothetical protein
MTILLKRVRFVWYNLVAVVGKNPVVVVVNGHSVRTISPFFLPCLHHSPIAF